jgi:tetratricopeptide (TPR) repeat protein
VRLSQDPTDNCSGCHLPKRNIKLIAHSSLTNHRIIARLGQPYPETAFSQTTSALPDLIHVNAIPGKEGIEIHPLTLLRVYGTLLVSELTYRARYLAILDLLAKTTPNDPLVLSALARKFKLEGTVQGTTQAMQCLSRAIELGSTSTTDYKDLADLLATAGQVAEAIELLNRGIAMNPYSSVLYKSLVLRYISIKKYPEALKTMREELRLFPEDSFMRNLIKQAEKAGPTP